MSGIGIIIMLIQILPFLGMPAASGGTMDAVSTLPESINNINIRAFTIATVTLLIVWQDTMPAPLVALIAGTLLGMLWLNKVPVIGVSADSFAGIAVGLAFSQFLDGTHWDQRLFLLYSVP